MKAKIVCTYLASFSIIFLVALTFLCESALSEEQKTDFSTSEFMKDRGKKLTIEQQEKLAQELFTVMGNTDKYDFDTFINLYERVIKECPDTERAQISLWRLSNLYLVGMEAPNKKKVIELMEHLISKYPDSPLVPNAKQRLLGAYEDTGDMKKALSLYEELFEKNPGAIEDPRAAAVMIGYAKALSATGDNNKALIIYGKIVSFGDKAEDFLVDIAKDNLSNLEQK